jgi:hypothetical protein
VTPEFKFTEVEPAVAEGIVGAAGIEVGKLLTAPYVDVP